jgi:hypothetical protein
VSLLKIVREELTAAARCAVAMAERIASIDALSSESDNAIADAGRKAAEEL